MLEVGIAIALKTNFYLNIISEIIQIVENIL